MYETTNELSQLIAVLGRFHLATLPLQLRRNTRGRNSFNRACWKIDTKHFPDNAYGVYIMRHGKDFLRFGATELNFKRRLDYFNHPFYATHPDWSLEAVYREYACPGWRGHLTHAFVLWHLANTFADMPLSIDFYRIEEKVLAVERQLLVAYRNIHGINPPLNREP